MISLILFLLSLLFLLMGYMVKVKLSPVMSEDGDTGPYKDSKGLALWMGSQWIFLGIFGIISTLVGFFMIEFKMKLMQAFLIMTVLMMIRIQRGVKRFY